MRDVGVPFVAGLAAAGLLIGLVLSASPTLRALPVPALAWPLGVSLVADLALMPLVRQGRIAPLRMEHRFGGVILATLIVMLVLALSGAQG